MCILWVWALRHSQIELQLFWETYQIPSLRELNSVHWASSWSDAAAVLHHASAIIYTLVLCSCRYSQFDSITNLGMHIP